MDDAAVPFGTSFSQENIERLKTKYSTEMKDDANNPIKICMKLVFEAAIERNPDKRTNLSLQLSRFLTEKDGVINLFLALIDFDTSSQKTTTHNQRFLAVAKIITYLPKLGMPYNDYCDNISRQLKPLLIHPNTLYSSLAAIIMKALIESPHARTKPSDDNDSSLSDVDVVVVGPILATLTSDSNDNFKISHAIEAINNLIQNHLPIRLFVDHFANLFFALVTLYDTPSRLKTCLKSSLTEILNDLPPGPACCLLEKTLFYESSTQNPYTIATEDEEITVELAAPTKPDDAVVNEILTELLEICDNNPLVVEYFFHFQSTMWTTCDPIITQRCVALIEPLLSQTIEEKPHNKLDILGSIMTNTGKSLELIDRTLMHYLDFLRLHHQHDETNGEARELAEVSINSCLNILQVLCTTVQADSRDLEMVHRKTLPTLREIRSILLDNHTCRASKKLIECLDSILRELTEAFNSKPRCKIDENLSSQREHSSLLRDLNDKLVPVRVHALVRLRQLLIANDKYTVDRIQQLYPMIEVSLADDEPYVFLASINLLAEMSLRKTDYIMPRLIALHARSDLDLQQRINVGEVLVRLTKRLNTTTPHYARQIVDVLLASSTSDPEELVRMSSLTNIGFICANLGNSLGKYMVDILASIRAILESDTIQVKCAAIDLLRTALMSLDKHNVESIQLDLKAIYTLLKKLAQRTLDEKLCLQVGLALDEIGRIAKEMFGVPSSDERQSGKRLVKNIKVLSLGRAE